MPKTEVFYLPGLKPARELLKSAPRRINKIFARSETEPAILELARNRSIPVEIVGESQLDSLCSRKAGPNITHQGIMAEISGPDFVSLPTLFELAPTAPLPLILALDQIQDAGNLGSIARSAWGLGCAGLLMPLRNSAPPGPAAFRTSAGALALLPICEATNLARALDEAAEHGFAIYGAENRNDAKSAYSMDWQHPAVLVLGNEAKGIRPGVAKRCDAMVSIPLARRFDSLNVAQAGAILTAFYAASFTGNSMQESSD